MTLIAAASGAIDSALLAGVQIEADEEQLVIDEVKLTFVSTKGILVNDYELVIVVGSRMVEGCAVENLCLEIDDEVVVPLTFVPEEVMEPGSVWVNVPFMPSIWKQVILPETVVVERQEIALIALKCTVANLDPSGFFPQTSSGTDASRATWFSTDEGSTWNQNLPSLVQPEGSTLIQIEIHPAIGPPQ